MDRRTGYRGVGIGQLCVFGVGRLDQGLSSRFGARKIGMRLGQGLQFRRYGRRGRTGEDGAAEQGATKTCAAGAGCARLVDLCMPLVDLLAGRVVKSIP